MRSFLILSLLLSSPFALAESRTLDCIASHITDKSANKFDFRPIQVKIDNIEWGFFSNKVRPITISGIYANEGSVVLDGALSFADTTGDGQGFVFVHRETRFNKALSAAGVTYYLYLEDSNGGYTAPELVIMAPVLQRKWSCR